MKFVANDFGAWYRGTGMATNSYQTHTEKLGNILGPTSRYRLVVPDFQRGYEWQRKHVDRFWRDIVQFKEAKSLGDEYFLGPVVLLSKTRKSPTIEILDGQQRLATVTILLCAIRDIAKTLGPDGVSFANQLQNELIVKEDGGKFVLQLGDTDRVYFRDAIQKTSPVSSAQATISTHKKIEAARKILTKGLKELLKQEGEKNALTALISLKRMLQSDFTMVCITVSSEREAYRIFETLNHRGLHLAPHDLLLNYLLRHAGTAVEREEIREHWSSMVRELKETPMGDFLRASWVSRRGDLKNKDLFTALSKHLEDSKIKSLEYVETVLSDCSDYLKIVRSNPADFDLTKCTALLKTIIKDLECDTAIPALIAGYQCLPVVDFQKLCELTIVFIVRHSIFTERSEAKLEDVLYKLAKDIRDMALDKRDARQCGKVMAHCRKLLEDAAPSDAEIKVVASKVEIEEPQIASYILDRIAVNWEGNGRQIGPKEVTLEHVFPLNPCLDDWSKADITKLAPMTWNIGNLTLYGEKVNGNIGASSFTKKRADYLKKAQLQITLDIAKTYQEWSPENIQDRAKRLIERGLVVWGFANTSAV